MKALVILGLILVTTSCKQSAEEQIVAETNKLEDVAEDQASFIYGNQPMEPRGQNYICQTGRPGLSVELMQIAWNDTDTGVEGMWYFNSSMDKPVRQVIHKQTLDLDKNILSGTFSYPGAPEMYEFKLTPKKFTSSYDGMVDVYELE